MKNILCYGDSNTWGYIPGGKGRYDINTRWTGVAGQLLGDEYRIIEEGLNGRTTVFDSPFDAELNGKKHLMCCLMSHAPLDCAVIMLGTNDLMHNHMAWEACRGCIMLTRMVLNSALYFTESKPKVLLVSPILIGENIAKTDSSPLAYIGREESLKFAPLYKQAAERLNVEFLDAALYAPTSEVDNEHMEAEGHRTLGEAIANKLRNMLA